MDCSLLFECFVPSWSVTFRLARLCVIQSNSVQFYIILFVCQSVGIFLHPVISCPVRSCSSYALTHPFLRHIVSYHGFPFIQWCFHKSVHVPAFNIVFNEMLVLFVAITFINTFHWFPIDLNCLSMISKDFHGGTTKHMGCNHMNCLCVASKLFIDLQWCAHIFVDSMICFMNSIDFDIFYQTFIAFVRWTLFCNGCRGCSKIDTHMTHTARYINR